VSKNNIKSRFVQPADPIAHLIEVLERIGLRYQRNGRGLRVHTAFRDGDSYSLAVNADGLWCDHGNNRRGGGYRALLDYIGVDPEGETAHLAPQSREQIEHARRESAQRAADEDAEAIEQALNCYKSASCVTLGAKTPADPLAPLSYYLMSRGISRPTVERLRTFAQGAFLHHSHVRYDRRRRQAVFPIYTGLSAAGQQTSMNAVQRIFIDEDGKRRTNRKGLTKAMLGRGGYVGADGSKFAGFFYLGSPADTAILAEGPETGVALWDASPEATVGIYYTAGGLAMLKPAVVARAARQRVVIAADNDLQSGTGERAARMAALRLHKARLGIEVLISMAPREIDGQTIGGAKGADWLDVVAAVGPEHAGELLESCAAKYVYDPADEELVVSPKQARGGQQRSPFPLPPNVRQVAKANVDRPSMNEAQAAKTITANGMHSAIVEEPGSVLRVDDTGTGKSHALREVVQDPETPALAIFAPTNDLADAQIMGVEKFTGRDHGRSGDETSPGYCRKFGAAFEDLQAGRRSLAHYECQNCMFGLSARLTQLAEGDENRDEVQERLIEAVAKSEKLPLVTAEDRRIAAEKAAAVPACDYIINRARTREIRHVVSTHASFARDASSHFAKFKRAPREMVERVWAFDESPALHDEIVAPLDRLNEWRAAAEKAAERDAPPGAGFSIDAWQELMREVSEDLKALCGVLAERGTTENYRLTGDDFDVERLATNIERMPPKIDGLFVEAVRFDRNGCRIQVPLRALRDLQRAIERGTAWAHSGVLIFTVPSRAADAILEGEHRVVISDATASRTLRQLVDNVHENLVDTPNQQVHYHVGRLHGKGSIVAPNSTEEADLIAEMEKAVRQYGQGKVMVLTSKALASPVRKRIEQGEVEGWRPDDAELVGWFGRHNRGDDSFYQRGVTALIHWGLVLPSPSVMERMYESDRRLLQDKGVELPAWDGRRVDRWFDLPIRGVNGEGYQLRRKASPNEAQVAWERDWVTAQLKQGIGRLRAAQRPSEQLNVHIHSNYPICGHGVWIDTIEQPAAKTDGTSSAAERTAEIEESARARVEEAAAATGGVMKTSKQRIQDYLKANKLQCVNNRRLCEILRELRERFAEDPLICDAAENATDEQVFEVAAEIAAIANDKSDAAALRYAELLDTSIGMLADELLAYLLTAEQRPPEPPGEPPA